jgi:hypothetical protein
MTYMDHLPAGEPTTANERIRSMLAKGLKFTEYETLPNGDVLGAVLPPPPRALTGWMCSCQPTAGRSWCSHEPEGQRCPRAGPPPRGRAPLVRVVRVRGLRAAAHVTRHGWC